MYGKIFESIFGSSVMEEDIETRYLWHCLIIVADQDGNIDMTPEALGRLVNLPLEGVRRALEKLGDADPKSRSPEEDGRRIVRLDEHRDWGWHLVNHQKYRQIRSPFDKRTYQREYMRERRAKLKADAGHRKTLVRHRLDKLGRLGHTEADSGSVVPSAPSASLNGSGTGGSVGPADRLRASHAELEWRIAETWRVHLATREKFWTRQNGAAPTGNGAPTLTKEVRAAITAALREHDHGRMGAADRELWKKESPVRAAGMGLFLSPWHTGADPRNATRYLEPWRPWKRQRGKPDPVPTFAQLYFEERAK